MSFSSKHPVPSTTPKHRAAPPSSGAVKHPRRSLVLGTGLALLVLAMPAALAVTGKLQAQRPAAKAAAELVVNGGFENGTTGWKTNHRRQSISTASQAAAGAASGRLSHAQSGKVVVNDRVPTVASTKAGQAFIVSALVRTTGPELQGRLRIREVASGGLAAVRGALFSATKSAWTPVELTYTSTVDGAKVDLNLVGFDVPAGAGLLVDEISMVAASDGATSGPSQTPSGTASASTSSSPSGSTSSSSTPSASASPTRSPSGTPSPTRPPTSPACVSDPMGIPAHGAYLGGAVGGTSDIDEREREYGTTLALHRTYYQAPQIDKAVRVATEDLREGRMPWISFKAPHSWEEMAAGDGNAWAAELGDALATVPGPVWLAVHHEPESDGDLNQWTEMQRQIAPIIHARTNNVAYSVIYSSWKTYSNGQDTVASKWPGDQHVDILAVDAYNHYGVVQDGKVSRLNLDLKEYYAKMAAWTKAHGTKAWAIGEIGQSPEGTAFDPGWLERSYRDMVAMGGSGFSWFDSSNNSYADWTLDDPVKRNVFKRLLQESPRVC